MSEGFRIKVSRSEKSIAVACRQALKAHLYHFESWIFYELFQKPVAINKMATAYQDGKPVGVTIYWSYGRINDEYSC